MSRSRDILLNPWHTTDNLWKDFAQICTIKDGWWHHMSFMMAVFMGLPLTNSTFIQRIEFNIAV
ncbi:hypothetical protein GYMLUDRAFT_555893 [Collybiopsis luxurians FD-317 M1]|uniref:Uncharacterized protein n=1 Tax=Collybiopsis luxurians FD-317 M1 TaxID=944289 RepID=A0A0D0CSI9_9AGAR|nr:hypothetical protein GYMLUDRAFT_555893 [Collybiopsis luxurians FD-317 M1]